MPGGDEYPKGGLSHPAKVAVAISAVPTRIAFIASTWTFLSSVSLFSSLRLSGLSIMYFQISTTGFGLNGSLAL
jgi:hypothetical protein